MHACVRVHACERLLDLMHALDADDLLCFQLLDLMHTLHTRAASIFSSWAEEEQRTRNGESVVSGGSCQGSLENIDAGASSLWIKCWCPLLQGQSSLRCHYDESVGFIPETLCSLDAVVFHQVLWLIRNRYFYHCHRTTTLFGFCFIALL